MNESVWEGTAPIPFPEHAFPLLRKALERIAAHPDEFYMGAWIVTKGESGDDNVADVSLATGLPFPACGTAACLGGHIMLATGVSPDSLWEFYDVGRDALESLGLDRDADASAWHRMSDVFDAIDVKTYAGLCDRLTEVFTFPEPLPADASAGRV